MDPVSKTDLAALRAQKKVDEKNAYIARLIKDVYAVVTAQARDTDGTSIQWCFARFSNLAEFPGVKEEVVTQLEFLFPECAIEYILPTDDADGRASHIVSVNWADSRKKAPAPVPEVVPPLVPQLVPELVPALIPQVVPELVVPEPTA